MNCIEVGAYSACVWRTSVDIVALCPWLCLPLYMLYIVSGVLLDGAAAMVARIGDMTYDYHKDSRGK